MHVGHIAAGLIAKRIDTTPSLGTLVLAAMLPDFLWSIFIIAGIEHVRFHEGKGAANYFDAYDIALSHSLLMDIVWAAVFAGLYYVLRHKLRGTLIIFALVLSHWVFDVIAHRPDMPVAPGLQTHLGLGLWANLPATIVVEGGLWVFALILYIRTTHARTRIGVIVFWIGVVLITLSGYNNVAGPPPPNPQIAPIVSLVYFSLVVGWAYWMNRLRTAHK